jgi:DNA-binding GntR family transcriptional regulator
MSRKTILRQQVYEQIKNDIIMCALMPGDPLSENELVERFKMSRTPIREALTSLVQDGLVEYTPNRGFAVTTISIMDINEIFEARIFIEKELFRMAIKKMSDAEIDQLEAQSQVQGDPKSPDYAGTFLEANLKFHLMLAAAGKNSRLLWYYEMLMNEAQRLFYMDITLHQNEFQWGHGHEGIIQALRNRDEETGMRVITDTLDKARKRVLGA